MPFQIVRNDITKMPVDAIVNAANKSLLGGGGVDGAIHRAAGPRLLEECRGLGGCRTGEAKLTRGYNLPCSYVIHTVGPVWQGGSHGERTLLASCYRASLALAARQGCESVAFPLISSGVYGYPWAEALQVAVEEITRFLMESDMTVYLVVFSRDALAVSEKLFHDVAAYIDDVYVGVHEDAPSVMRRRRTAALSEAKDSICMADEPMAAEPMAAEPMAGPSLAELLAQRDESFAQSLLRLIDERGLTDAECYKRANIDRRLFNKIKNNPDYKPGKQTALALAVALRLTLPQTRDLLMKAGFALSHSSKADIVVEYCIATGRYDIVEINELLFSFDLPLLGY